MDTTEVARFLEVPLELEALVEGTSLRVRDLLALKPGSVVETQRPAGENVDVRAGNAPLCVGELAASHGRVIVRVVGFRGKE